MATKKKRKRGAVGKKQSKRTGDVWLCFVESGPPRKESCAPIPAGDVAEVRKVFKQARFRSGASASVSGNIAVFA